VRALAQIGIDRILNLVGDQEYADGGREQVRVALERSGIQEHRVPVVDYGGLSDEVFEEAATVVNRWLDEGRTVYVHCRAGWQRSAAVAAGILAVRDGIDVESALRIVQSRRPSANPLPHQREDLHRWWLNRVETGSSPAPEGVTRA
jgi:atypical dual specificity phosphatase